MNVALGDHPDCVHDAQCPQFSHALHDTLKHGYGWPASILVLDSIELYVAAHRTARKRAARAERRGYEFSQISRSDFADDVYAINTSAAERQGRPMSKGYRERYLGGPLPDYPCTRHRIDEYGVLLDGTLVAYLVLYVCGEVALVSQIIGHANHLEAEIMYLLVQGAFRETLERSGPVTVFYNMHDSGTEGLRFFKERLGFTAQRVQWTL